MAQMPVRQSSALTYHPAASSPGLADEMAVAVVAA